MKDAKEIESQILTFYRNTGHGRFKNAPSNASRSGKNRLRQVAAYSSEKIPGCFASKISNSSIKTRMSFSYSVDKSFLTSWR